ncbi:MAG: PIN domain-containing protein [Candidatus Sumerlaeota bacterium]
MYGGLRFQLGKKGRPIPGNDVWIAGLALQHNLPLVTHDAHFLNVDGLDLRDWLVTN